MATRSSPDPAEQFRLRLEDMERRIQELMSRPAQIPILDANPDVSYPGNIWSMADGKLRVRNKSGTITQYTPVAVSAPGAVNPPPVAQPITRVGEWGAVWTQAYRQSGGFTGGDSRYLYYGNSGSSSYNGRQTSLIGLDYAAIAAALAGSIISKCEIYLYNIHTWGNSGATAHVASHFNATKPGTLGGINTGIISSFPTKRSTGAWHTVSNQFAQWLRDGTSRGFTLQAPNDSTAYYGYAAGIGGGTAPIMRITYIK